MYVYMLHHGHQGYGRSLWVMHGMFKANGQCGYVKKPDFLLKSSDDDVFVPRATRPVTKTLKVTLCLLPVRYYINFAQWTELKLKTFVYLLLLTGDCIYGWRLVLWLQTHAFRPLFTSRFLHQGNFVQPTCLFRQAMDPCPCDTLSHIG